MPSSLEHPLPRFFVPSRSLASADIVIDGDLAHRLGRVLRMRPGDRMILLDGRGRAVEAAVSAVRSGAVHAIPLAERHEDTETASSVVLCAALLKARRWDLVLQKGTELGLARFVPVMTEHSVVALDERPSPTRAARWGRIVEEAAEQSRRTRLPTISSPVPLEDAFASVPENARAVIGCVHARAIVLRDALGLTNAERGDGDGDIWVFVGPEGGFSPGEVDTARHQGIVPVGLGPRVLRAETAALVMTALVMHELGELRPRRMASAEC